MRPVPKDDSTAPCGTPSSSDSDTHRPDQSGRGRWTWIQPAIAIGLVALAAFLLYRTLSRYDYDELVASVTDIPLPRLAAAIGFAAASYLCLTGFDWLALRYVGHPLPYRKAAWASFTSLSLGHNIGLAALSSGAIRYRFYSRWGLEGEEVAKIIVFCGITVGLGLATLGGLAIVLGPDLASEITGLGRPLVLGLAAVCLAVPAAWLVLACVVKRPLCFRRWAVSVPGPKLALAQVVVGTVNFGLVAACLHQALAAAGEAPYLSVVSVYVLANVATLVSHVPGGLGVIETVVTHLLPQTNVIGAVLIFRFVYFLLPLALGGTLFAATELWFKARGERESGTSAAASAAAGRGWREDAPARADRAAGYRVSA
jgi:uncharacterized membrane protein YbhN (UPF0104 family)